MLNKIKILLSSRLVFLTICILILFTILISKVFYIQIIKGEEYANNHTKRLEREIVINGSRGNIYDKNGKLLAYNKQNKVLIVDTSMLSNYVDDGEYNTRLNTSIINAVNILRNNNQSLIQNDFPIVVNSENEYEYNISDQVVLLNFLKDIFSKSSIDDLTVKEKNISAEILMNELAFKTNNNSDYEDLPHFKLNADITNKQLVLDVVNIRNLIFQHRYQKYKNIVIAKDIDNQTIVDIEENKESILGISIIDNLERVYNDSIYISNIIGYTSKNDENNQIIGQMGIEKNLNDILTAKEGYKKIYVDSTGKILDEVETSTPSYGNDVYLSIDIDLQKFAYNKIEDVLTKFYLEHLVNSNNFVYDVRDLKDGYFISSGMIYNSLLTNGVINIKHLSNKLASETEKKLYNIISPFIKENIDRISNILLGDTPIKYVSDDEQMLIKFLFTYLQNENIIDVSKLNSDDETIKSWLNKDLLPKTYLSYLIGNNYINIDNLGINKKYSDVNDVANSIIAHINDKFYTDRNFLTLISEKLFINNLISGRDIIQILYDQEFLKKDDHYKNFENGKDSYSYLIELIENKILTPGIIGVEPFSAAFVMNDTNTGKVLAMVSYPGYDNNMMEDNNYLRYIMSNSTSQLLNRATQLMKAPGSTFKPIMALAGLEEDVIEPYETVYCNGVFDTVTPEIKCWIYPGGHGSLNTIGGISNSCNVYFNEIGHRLGSKSKDEKYSNAIALNYIEKYAAQFGLDKKTGLEIDEEQPHISDENGILSSIGQGTHLFNSANLARYVTTLANEGKVVNLSLVDKIQNTDGTIKQKDTEIINNVQFNKEYMNVIKLGMRNVVTGYNYFDDVPVNVAGKTGTAQENLAKNDNNLFISFSPYENPEVATSIIYTNMGTKVYHLSTTAEILKYYYANR